MNKSTGQKGLNEVIYVTVILMHFNNSGFFLIAPFSKYEKMNAKKNTHCAKLLFRVYPRDVNILRKGTEH